MHKDPTEDIIVAGKRSYGSIERLETAQKIRAALLSEMEDPLGITFKSAAIPDFVTYVDTSALKPQRTLDPAFGGVYTWSGEDAVVTWPRRKEI